MIEGPVTNRRVSRRLIRQIMLFGGAALLVAVLAGAGYWVLQGQARNRAQAADQAAQQQAEDIARQVAEPFAELRDQLVAAGGSAEIIAAFDAGDATALESLAAARTGAFRSALRLRLLRPGIAEPEPDAHPPLSFASLDMLRRVEDSAAPVSAEVHLFDTPNQHIVMGAPALDASGQLRGLLHLSLDVALLGEIMKGISAPGRAELSQSAGAREMMLAELGAPASAGVKPVIVSVPDTRWNITYFPAGGVLANVAAPGGGMAGTWLAVALLVLLGGAATVVFLRRRAGADGPARRRKGEGIVYAGAVKAIMEGAHPGMEKLVPNLPDLGQSRPITGVSRGMAGGDITMIAPRRELAGADENSDPTPVPKPTLKSVTPKAAPKPRTGTAPAPAPPKPAAPSPPAAPARPAAVELDRGIFRAYDIRGVVGKSLTAEVVTSIGQAIGTEAGARRLQKLVVGRDGRLSSPEFAQALIEGLRSAGRDVIDIGMVPTPVLYFATHELGVDGGVMVTGSHNGPEYNGIKIVLGDDTLSESAIQALYTRIMSGDLEAGQGGLESSDVVAAYVRRISDDIPVAFGGALRIIIDCGNGVAGVVAPQVIKALGHDVIEMNCEVDGRFPNHHPDPSQPENLAALIAAVTTGQADLGLAFDGDGDRLGVVDAGGRVIWPDQQLMVLARDVLARNPGAPIIFDVKCSRHLGRVIEAAGGTPLMWRTGHSLIKRKMKETDAPLAGEMSGHIFFKERWYGFDDAIYTAARLLEVLMAAKRKPAEVFAGLPQAFATPELRVPLPESEHEGFMQALRSGLGAVADAQVIDIDGFRVEFADGWGLVRPSNTSPALVVRFEADDEGALARIKGSFRGLLLAARPDLDLPF